MSQKAYKKLISFLKDNDIEYKEFRHAPVRTSEEADKLRPEYTLSQGAKAIIVKARFKGGKKEYYMLILPGNKKFNSKKVRKILACQNFSFATDEEVINLTGGVLPGGIHPFGNLFNLEVFVDQRLKIQNEIIFNAGDRSISIAILSRDFFSLAKPKIVDLI